MSVPHPANWISTTGVEERGPEIAWDGTWLYMRDSGHTEGPVLRFTRAEWEAFLIGAKDGEFDLGGSDG